MHVRWEGRVEGSEKTASADHRLGLYMPSLPVRLTPGLSFRDNGTVSLCESTSRLTFLQPTVSEIASEVDSGSQDRKSWCCRAFENLRKKLVCSPCQHNGPEDLLQ
ncbi:hypothetical protein SKAU_G00011810 [Synaphobranchus kaupii]|uniref:Uncharacterized protein n=1 Tax=Synaphobranchus kaupii TaxID=118154 RepID=A0A9Q1GBA8_SYNKA|nr:hypothetical protein SKAU_G00011810 [Synaphobranchus kaupii]